MARPKHDYDSQEFFTDIATYAAKGFADEEIADMLDLDPDVFSKMKNGKYKGWTEEENKRRGNSICRVLARARRKTNAVVRGTYLKLALGGRKLKNKSTTKRQVRDMDGNSTGEEDIQTTESEIELAPNLQALSTWLYHHDEEWRKIERKQDEDADIPQDIEHGINIDKWIREETK